MRPLSPLDYLCITFVVWALTVWQNTRLVRMVWKRQRHIAQSELPLALHPHPENILFFFRSTAKRLQGDAAIWWQRRLFLLLFALSLMTPVATVVAFCLRMRQSLPGG